MRRLLTIAVTALMPSLAFAGGVHITSHQERHLRVRGDETRYALVRAGSPLTFDVTGPAKVSLVVRQAFHPGMRPGRTVTRVVVSQDGQRLQSFFVRQPQGGHWDRAPIRGRPSTPRTLEIDVPAGTHRYRLAIGPRRRELAVAPSAARPSPLALVPLVSLHEHPAAHADNGGAAPGIPLVGLVPQKKAHRHAEQAANTLPSPDAVPLVGLTPPKAHTADQGSSKPAAATQATGKAMGSSGAVAMNTGHDVQIEHVDQHGDEGPTAPPVAVPETPPPARRPGRIVLALRGLVASHGIGGGTIGGGVGARMRTDALGGHMSFGLSVDVVPYALRVSYVSPAGVPVNAHGSVEALPILAVAAYTQRLGQGALSLELTAGAGIVYASASLDGRNGSGLAPGGALSAGLLLDAGPGALSVSLRAVGGWGTIGPGSGPDRTPLLAGPLGGLGAAVGYELSL